MYNDRQVIHLSCTVWGWQSKRMPPICIKDEAFICHSGWRCIWCQSRGISRIHRGPLFIQKEEPERDTQLMNVCTTIHFNIYSSTDILCNLLLQICCISEVIIEHFPPCVFDSWTAANLDQNYKQESLSLNYWLSDVIIIVITVNHWLVQEVELPHWLLLFSSSNMNMKLPDEFLQQCI